MKHKTTHTCESALFYNLEIDIIKRNCQFDYFYDTKVIPSVLDGGDQIILANMLSEKKLNCKAQHHLDVPLDVPQHSYVMVNRSILCGCNIDADYISVLSSISACEPGAPRPPLKFTVNMAYQLYIDEITQGYDKLNISVPKLGSFRDHAYGNLSSDQPILPFSLPDVRDPENNERPESIDELIEDLGKMETYLVQAQIDNDALTPKPYPDDLTFLDKWQTQLFYFLCALTTILLILAICMLCYKYKDLKGLFYSVSSSYIPLAKAQGSEEGSGFGPYITPIPPHVVTTGVVIQYLIYGVVLLILLYKIYRFCLTFFRGKAHPQKCSLYLCITREGRYHMLRLIDVAVNMFSLYFVLDVLSL